MQTMQEKNSHKSNFIISRLKRVLNISSDYELAKMLGVAKSTISTWKARDTVDYDLIFAKFESIPINYHWLLTGEGSMYKGEMAEEPDPPPAVGLGARFRKSRELLGISRQQVAEGCSLTPHLINQIESNKQTSLPVALIQHLHSLGIDLNSLFGSKDEVVLRQGTVNNQSSGTLPPGPCQQCALRDKVIRAQELALQALSQPINTPKNHS